MAAVKWANIGEYKYIQKLEQKKQSDVMCFFPEGLELAALCSAQGSPLHTAR